LLQIFKDVYGRLSKLRKAAEQSSSHNPLLGSTQLQLGVTTAALLQLHPQHSLGTPAAAAAAAAAPGGLVNDNADDEEAAELEHYRLEMLSLLCSEYHALRIRAGPLAALVITDAANTAAAAAAAGSEAASSSSGAVVAAVTAAMAEVQQQLLLQRSFRPDQQQAELLQLLQLPPDLISPEQEETKKALQRSLKSLLVCWDSALVQIADVAAAATAAAAAAAVRLEEPPNALDALLLQLVCGHAAFVQQLPADLLPTYDACETDSKASQMRLAAAALDVIAAQQQYSSRFGYLAYHAPAWIWQWFNSGRSFDHLLLLQPLLRPPQQAGGSSSADGAAAHTNSKADALQLLDRYGSSIMSSLMQAEAEQELQAVADAAGRSTSALIDRWCWQITATLYPALTRPFKSDATAAKAGVIAERMNLKSRVRVRQRHRFILLVGA
jgi:hypothetical protein